MNKGFFITFEGGEGAGKSTHIRFLAEILEDQGYEVLFLREPGGTAIGEKLREILLDPEHDAMSDEAELLMYEAARAQIVEQVIKPAIEKGSVVLCDRFYDSTLAYQAYGRGLDEGFIQQANLFASQGLSPDKTILLTCGPAKEGLNRATQHTGADRLEGEGEAFHNKVNQGFLEIAKSNPERIRIVKSAEHKSDTAAAIFAQLADLFPWILDTSIITDEVLSRIDTRYYGNKHKNETIHDEEAK